MTPAPGLMRIAYRDLSVRDQALKAELLQAVDRVLSHGRLILGPEVEEFERNVAELCGRRYCVGVNSGTDALYLALRALDVGPGDEVITTPLSWVATVNAIVLAGATPVFADIGEDLNIDASLIERLIGPRTKAILPVHFTGQMCDIERIAAIAGAHKISVVEDAAQAFGASRNGRRTGSFGTLSCFSMNPMKVYNAYGEAGAVLTDEDHLRERLVALRYAGTLEKNDCVWPSLNGRLDTIQAAMLNVVLPRVPGKIERRRAIAAAYAERLRDIVTCPRERPGEVHVFYTYSVLADRRNALMAHLAARGVETQVQHPIPMPRQTAYRDRIAADIPVCERAVDRIVCLPNQEDLTAEEVDYVSGCVREFYGA